MLNTEDLDQRIAKAFAARGIPFDAKKMMGGVAFMVDAKMCVGTAKQSLMVRFDPELHDQILAKPGAAPMDFTGKPMRGYVFVSSDAVRTDTALAEWIDLALAFNPRAKRSRKSSGAGRPRG